MSLESFEVLVLRQLSKCAYINSGITQRKHSLSAGHRFVIVTETQCRVSGSANVMTQLR